MHIPLEPVGPVHVDIHAIWRPVSHTEVASLLDQMASKAGSRIRNIINRIPTGAITNPNTNEKIKLSIATEVRTENSHWVRPEEVAQGQADALWKVIDHNKEQLKPGTVEISQM